MANLRFRRSRDGPSSVLVAWRGHPGEDSWEPTSEFHPDDLAGVAASRNFLASGALRVRNSG